MSVRHKVKELIDKKYEELEKIGKNPLKVYVVFSPKDNLEDFDPELAEVLEFELDKENEESKKKFLDRLLREVLESEVKNMVWCGFVVDTKEELIPILEQIPKDQMVEFINLKKEE
ncbi:hypothetical protein [Hydrogenobaculum acidophilum]